MIANFVTAAGKVAIGIVSSSFFVLISGAYSAGVGACKQIFYRGAARAADREEEWKYYRNIAVGLLLSGFFYGVSMVRYFFSPDLHCGVRLSGSGAGDRGAGPFGQAERSAAVRTENGQLFGSARGDRADAGGAALLLGGRGRFPRGLTGQRRDGHSGRRRLLPARPADAGAVREKRPPARLIRQISGKSPLRARAFCDTMTV